MIPETAPEITQALQSNPGDARSMNISPQKFPKTNKRR